MTAVDQPQLELGEFEELASSAPEAVRLEYVYGKLGVKAMPDGDHTEILQWLLRQLLMHLPDFGFYQGDQGLKVQSYRKGRVKPDGILAPLGSFSGQGEWAEPTAVRMVTEITSYDSDTDRRDRVEKPRAYAEAGIPVYLLIDRDSCEVLVFSRPLQGTYSAITRLPFGQPVELPQPVGITLETEPLKSWVR